MAHATDTFLVTETPSGGTPAMSESPESSGATPPAPAGRDAIYDPLRRENLGRSVLWALVSTQAVPLGEIPDFRGSGIYAIYYTGYHELYQPISSSMFHIPIYVGKADPKGSRKGETVGHAWEGHKLRDRLRAHSRKIDKALDLELGHFHARFLPADDLFTPMAERLMISELRPVWNLVLEGFGVNRQGSGRETNQLRPKWHELHPGVEWADGMPGQPGGAAPLHAAVVAHLKLHSTPPASAEGGPGQPGITDPHPI
ncbi:Eco29kI family restriction endonuclease [Streptomyces tubercidicus]|uniref:Eco29kI family restriction endonuclease n=1 Tax=Streptomyces tubercidicus TaxID=47759 RepID=UPI002E1114B5|nr:Eco29kI family restriction endonuclease [Streptomyces tubercidicus]